MTAEPSRTALEAMLEARSVALVGASERPGTFGARMVDEVSKSASRPDIYLVNPRYTRIGERPCFGSLDEIPGPVDLVLLGVPDASVESAMSTAAKRGDRSAVIFGGAVDSGSTDGNSLRERICSIANDAGMELCGAGCMGFVNVARGLRAIGYVEPDPIPLGPIALVSCSGSAFSAMLRTHRRFGWTVAISSGQELVTSAASYLDYAVGIPQTRVVALVLETMREPTALRGALERAAAGDVAVVSLTVGRSERGKAMVTAHSGALAGDDASWEALFDAHGVIRTRDLDEMADTLELFCGGRMPGPRPPGGGGIATVHDSGGERALAVDLANDLSLPFASISPATGSRLGEYLDPGLEPTNPLDLWGTGSDTADKFGGALSALAQDPETDAVALCVDLVFEYDGDDSYEKALVDAHRRTTKPVALLSNLQCAVDQAAAARLRAVGIPVLEGTRSGMLAMRHMIERRDAMARPPAPCHEIDGRRRQRWLTRLGEGPLSGTESLALLADYGIRVANAARATSADEAARHAEAIGFPVVLKTDVAGIDHKSDVGGVVMGLADLDQVVFAYRDLAERLGPEVLVAECAPEGVELALGIVRDPGLGPIVVVGAGGLLVELIHDRSVGLPPIDLLRARHMLDRLGVRPLLDGIRGAAPCDMDAAARAVVSISVLACELGEAIEALDVNPIRCGPDGADALDALVVASATDKIARPTT
ncbi:MAG: acetate--CoA ligase family protein [Acidimicrobiales bacterium]